MDGTVATEDDPPAALGAMPEAFIRQLGERLRPGRLLRFALGPGGVTFRGGQAVGADLRYEGPANQRRGRADSLSKILFQHLCRTAPIGLPALLAAAEASEGGAEAPAGGAGALCAMGSGGEGSGGGGGGGSMSLVSGGVEGGSAMVEAGPEEEGDGEVEMGT